MLGLGIDTGGTYTDAVVYDFDTRAVVARAKALTTRRDLTEGIDNALRALGGGFAERVGMVSLSTTLATNACVEGKGSHAALFLLGYDPLLYDRLKAEYGLGDIEIYHFRGIHSQRGEPVDAPDYDAIRAKARALKGRVEALGVVEYWGVRNPEYETGARAAIREAVDLPIAVAHELTGDINSLRRAATTALNARLIPLNARLMDAVTVSLGRIGVDAPLMVVRGDGSLMTRVFAGERPVETLLSGPAASVLGGVRLSGESDAVIVDVGGTTTDVALVRAGRAVRSGDGVDIGRWRTGTRALSVRTVGLGGDSRVTFDKFGALAVGPRRALPLCMLAAQYPRIKDELRRIMDDDEQKSYARGEFFVLSGQAKGLAATPQEGAVLEALSEGALSIDALSARAGVRPYFLDTERLEFLGVVQRAAFTPTDWMHVAGAFGGFDAEASLLGAQALARRVGITVEALGARVMDICVRGLYRVVADMLLGRAMGAPPADERLMAYAFGGGGDEARVAVTSALPLIGIGAPTHIFLPAAAAALGTRAVAPPDAAVANAVGAITGIVAARERVLIKPHFEAYGVDGYSCHSSDGYERFDEMDDALTYAYEEARRIALRDALAMGARAPEVSVTREDLNGTPAGENTGAFLLEAAVTAVAVGQPDI